MRRLAALTALVLAAAACSGAAQDAAEPAAPTPTATSPGDDAADPSAPADDAEAAAGASDDGADDPSPGATPAPDAAPEATAPADEPPTAQDSSTFSAVEAALRAGVWQVGDAGTVEFAVTPEGALDLIEVVPAEGWTVTDEDVAPDEIEVDFQRGTVEYEIEIEIEGGILEIEIDQDIDDAEPGRYAIGEAGAVEFAVTDGRLVLVEATAADGWDLVIEEEIADEIELELRRGDVTWDVAIELDDGIVEIEIDFEIEGPLER